MFPLFYLLGVVFLIVPTVRLPIIGLSPSDVFIFAAFGWLLLETFVPRREKRAQIPIHVLWIPAGIILVGGTLASIGAISPFSSLWQTLKVCFVLAPWVSMGIVMVRRGYLMHILYAFIFSGAIAGAVALIDVMTDAHLGALISGVTTNYWRRMTGTFGHPSTLGYFTCVALPVSFGVLADEWQNKRRPFLVIPLALATGLIAVALFNSGSVTGWIGTLVALCALGVVWLVRARSWTRWGVGIAGLVIALLVIGALAFNLVPTRIMFIIGLNLERASETTGPGRLAVFARAFELINQNPIIGVGMDQTGTSGIDRQLAETVTAVHNTVISGWLNGGLLTFLGLVLAYALAILTALRGLNYGAGNKHWIVLTLSAATLAWIIFDQTQPQLSQRFTWMTVSLLYGLGFGIQLVAPRLESSAGGRPSLSSVLRFPVGQGKAGAGK